MSAYTPTDSDTRRAGAAGAYDPVGDESGLGWIVFAAVILVLLGTVNFIQGIAAVGNAHFFVRDTSYVFGSLNTWGWVAIAVGLIQMIVAAALFTRNQFARGAGVGLLAIAALVELLMMPAYPLWGLTLFATNIFALYGLAAHAPRQS